MVRMRAEMDMGWPTDAVCKCNKAKDTTEHVMTCPSADMSQMRHSLLFLGDDQACAEHRRDGAPRTTATAGGQGPRGPAGRTST